MTISEANDPVVLVDENDREVGSLGKLEAHRTGRLHRAFSVFVFNEDGEVLLQQRSPRKYHSGGLWTNTCCSHPRPMERIELAAERRLREEMGLQVRVRHQFSFIYRADLGNGMTENEFDHVFFAFHCGDPFPDPMEVADWRWVTMEQLDRELSAHPERFTVWLRSCWSEVMRYRRSEGPLAATG
ncbi:MAG: isopentenyl-diphosphate Delta-isomerase [Flavobacteriales bacterium]|nr:isopentenyl-diphosphate Delta-isomerase [Flavobacteriales bacterium]